MINPLNLSGNKSDLLLKKENNLFPIFLQLENLRLLIIGGGSVALEKLHAVLNNAPATNITLVAINIHDKIYELAKQYSNLTIIQKAYDNSDWNEIDIAIAAVNDIELAALIKFDANQKGKLVNVADKPEFCDFYLSSIVKKGNLKIAISTNGKSPTIAKRLKEVLNEMVPEEIDDVLDNMQSIRLGMNGDFADKVKQLNDLTKVLVAKKVDLAELKTPKEKKWQKIVKWCLLAFVFMIVGHAILSLIPSTQLADGFKTLPQYLDKMFFFMMLTGFLAQMVDGSLGMGYGTISTTFLLSLGHVSPALVSSHVHTARVFSSGVSGYTHHRFGNINRKLFKTLVVPGIIGAVIGATLAYFGQKYNSYVRLPLALYTCYLGYFIIRKAFAKKQHQAKVKRAGWLASVGGFLDAFAGGGWGTLVTSTLIAKRKNARYVIGSVCLTEFFVVLTSSITFFILLNNIPVKDVAGMILGGVIAAPIAARLVGKLPLKTMYVAIGSMVVLTSLFTLWKVVSQIH